MLSKPPHFMTVQVGDGLDPRNVAASIQTCLAAERVTACWLHVHENLAPVLHFACRHREVPLVVTTAGSDWAAFERDRGWCERTGSIAFVLPGHALALVPPQVGTMLRPGAVIVRRNLMVANRDEANRLAMETRELLVRLSLPLDECKIVATDVGVATERVPWNKSDEAVVFELLQETLRSDLLDQFVFRLYERRGNEELAALFRVIRGAHESP